MKVSMVSASRRAGPPHCGQVVFMKVGLVVSGDSPAPVNCTSSGSSTGSCSSGTGTMPHCSQ